MREIVAGEIRWVHERGVKTIDRDGLEWIDGIIFDVTDRRAADQLRVARELEALRVAELEASRARIVEAGDAARRRIERDLHDGAQHRLVVATVLATATRARSRTAGSRSRAPPASSTSSTTTAGSRSAPMARSRSHGGCATSAASGSLG